MWWVNIHRSSSFRIIFFPALASKITLWFIITISFDIKGNFRVQNSKSKTNNILIFLNRKGNQQLQTLCERCFTMKLQNPVLSQTTLMWVTLPTVSSTIFHPRNRYYLSSMIKSENTYSVICHRRLHLLTIVILFAQALAYVAIFLRKEEKQNMASLSSLWKCTIRLILASNQLFEFLLKFIFFHLFDT